MARQSFEANFRRLEELASKLESGNLSLEQSIKVFEEGIRLSRLCEKQLEDAKSRIDKLVRSDTGSLELKELDM